MNALTPAPRHHPAAIVLPAAIILLWGLLQYAWHPGFFWNDDFQVQATAFFEEMVRSWREGEWPILSRSSWVTGNLAGEFQFCTFSPTLNALLLLIWAFPLSLPAKAAAIAIVHLMWLATGVFVLGRARGLSAALATTAALATSLSGWLIAWGATNWISYVIGFSWVPWVWWAMHAAIASDSVWQRWLRPGLVAALAILAGNTFAILMLPVIGVWLILQAGLRDRFGRAAGPVFVAGILGAGLSAPAWWSLLEAAMASPRWGWGASLQTAWVVPWSAWPGLVLPSWVTPWSYYSSEFFPHTSVEMACGLVPIAALVAALLFSRQSAWRGLGWELALLIVCVLMVSFPSIGQFRWSFRWLPLFHLVLALTAARAWQNGWASRASLCSIGLVALTWAGATALGANRSPVLAAWILGVGIAWWIVEHFGPKGWAPWLPAAVIVVTLGATYRCLPTQHASFQARFSFDESILSPEPLDQDRLYVSLYSFQEIVAAETRPRGFGTIVRPGNSMHYAGLRFLNGYSSYQGREVRAIFESHGETKPATAESLAGPEGERLLSFLGVDGIVCSAEYAHFAQTLGPEWQKVEATAEGVVYHREPRRFAPVKALTYLFDRPEIPLAHPDLRLIKEGRNRVTVEIKSASQRARSDLGVVDAAEAKAVAAVAFVRPWLRGYEARFNGAPVTVRAYRNMLPLVELPGNAEGILELVYRPRGLTVGSAIVALTAGLMFIIALAAATRPARVAALRTNG